MAGRPLARWRTALKVVSIFGRGDGGLAQTLRYREFRSEEKPAALANGALDPDLSTHQFHELLRNRQSQPGAAVPPGGRGIGLGEVLEDTGELLLRNPDPGVLYAEKESSPLLILRVLLHFDIHSSGFGEFHRIPQ